MVDICFSWYRSTACTPGRSRITASRVRGPASRLCEEPRAEDGGIRIKPYGCIVYGPLGEIVGSGVSHGHELHPTQRGARNKARLWGLRARVIAVHYSKQGPAPWRGHGETGDSPG
eukprot:scaffold15049_cov67-Phaeocystis_antarctica.AAC.2